MEVAMLAQQRQRLPHAVALYAVLLGERALGGQDFAAREACAQLTGKRRDGRCLDSFRSYLVAHGCGPAFVRMLTAFSPEFKANRDRRLLRRSRRASQPMRRWSRLVDS